MAEEDQKNLEVLPSGHLSGKVTIPPDKSISIRAILFSLLAEDPLVLSPIPISADALSAKTAVEAFGVRVAKVDGAQGPVWRLGGPGAKNILSPKEPIDVMNSGTTIRLLSGIVSGLSVRATLTGDEQILNRPMDRVIEPLKQLGANIRGAQNNTRAPLMIRGAELTGAKLKLAVPSAQVKSALMLAALSAKGVTHIEEPVPSRDHTENLLKLLGVKISKQGSTWMIPGETRLHGGRIPIPGDPSSAAFLVVAALIVPNSDLFLQKVLLNPRRVGFLRVLSRMGAKIVRSGVHENIPGEPVGNLKVSTCAMKGTIIEAGEIPDLIDEVPILAVAAAFSKGPTEFRGLGELKVKESDRVRTVAALIRSLGGSVEEVDSGNGLIIQGSEKEGGVLRGGVVDSFGDHRIALAGTVAGLAAREGARIRNAAVAQVSYPEFYETLRGFGVHINSTFNISNVDGDSGV